MLFLHFDVLKNVQNVTHYPNNAHFGIPHHIHLAKKAFFTWPKYAWCGRSLREYPLLFSFMEPPRKTKLVSYYKLMVGYLHVEAVGPTRGQMILMGLQSQFEKMAQKRPFLSRISTKSQNFTTCKFVGHSPTLAVPAKIMSDHPEKCQEQKHVFFPKP